MSGKDGRELVVNFIVPEYWPCIGGCEVYTHQLVKRISKQARVRVIAQINSQSDKTVWERTQKQGKPSWWWWPKEPYHYGLWSNLTFQSDKAEFQEVQNNPEVWLINPSDIEKKLIWRFFDKERECEDRMIGVLSRMFERKIRRLVNRGEVFHCVNGGFSYLYHAALSVAGKLHMPVVFTPILHLYHFGWEKDMADALKNDEPFEYKPDIHFFDEAQNRLSERYIDSYWKEVCRRADCIATLTEYEKAYMIKMGFDADKIEKVGCGPVLSDQNGTDIKKKYRIPDGPIVLFVGRNHESKGIKEILEAAKVVWKKRGDVNFLFLGPHESHAPGLYEKMACPQLITPGVVDDREKTAAFKACDLLCMPSLHESLGIAYLEAWMYEKPILAADIPQVRELTENGKGGVLVNAVPHEIAEGILRILENPDEALEMGKWGKDRVLNEYNWDITSQKMLRIYQKLLS